MLKRDYRIIEFLNRYIRDNVRGVEGWRLASCVALKNDIISIGYNQKKSHPLQQAFGQCEHKLWMHAEIDAIRKAVKYIDISQMSKATIYVTRLRQDDSVGISMPCGGCHAAIRSHNIGRVVFTQDDGSLDYYRL